MSNEENNAPFMRTIKSFVIREGRMTPGQERAMETLWPEFGIEHNDQILDTTSLFANTSPTIIEIGFGMGHSLADMAIENPDKNYIGIEVHRPGVGTLLKRIGEDKITNIRVMCFDAVEILDKQIQDASPNMGLDGIQIYFPDPWHKARHHKRRLIQPKFVRKLIQKLKPGGFIHLATDWENYAEQMMEVMSEFPELDNKFGQGEYAPDRCGRPITKFEKRGERLGHGVWDLYFVKNEQVL